MKKYVIDKGCKLCNGCFWVCPAKAIYIEDDRTARIDQEKCLRCGKCYESCANEAISIYEEATENTEENRNF